MGLSPRRLRSNVRNEIPRTGCSPAEAQRRCAAPNALYSPPRESLRRSAGRLAPSSSLVQDISLSRIEQGFESPWGHSTTRPRLCRGRCRFATSPRRRCLRGHALAGVLVRRGRPLRDRESRSRGRRCRLPWSRHSGAEWAIEPADIGAFADAWTWSGRLLYLPPRRPNGVRALGQSSRLGPIV